MPQRRSAFLAIGWVVTLALGVWSGSVAVLGVRHDTRAGEPTIPLSLGEPSDWRTASFRVWNAGQYTLFLSTVNFDRARVGSRFRGELQVVIRRPSGDTFFDHRFNPATIDHTMPYNYGDTKFAGMALEAARVRPWTVAVRVTRADPQFAGVGSELKLWRDRTDPGMGGLIAYVLIIPAMILLLLAVVLSFVLARRGRLAPFVLSSAIALAFFIALMA
jgi:hypothetical protein